MGNFHTFYFFLKASLKLILEEDITWYWLIILWFVYLQTLQCFSLLQQQQQLHSPQAVNTETIYISVIYCYKHCLATLTHNTISVWLSENSSIYWGWEFHLGGLQQSFWKSLHKCCCKTEIGWFFFLLSYSYNECPTFWYIKTQSKIAIELGHTDLTLWTLHL